MPASALIAPDNRLLGWSLTDLTLYGTQPVPGMVVGRAGDAIATPAGQPAAAPAPSDPAALAPAFHDVAEGQTALLDGGAHDGGAVPASPVVSPHHASPVAEFAPSVPQPVGAGSFVQPPAATALPAIESHGAAAATAEAPAAAPPVATMPDGTQPSAPIAAVLDAAHDALAASTPAPVGTVLSSAGELTGHAPDAAAPVTDLLGHTLDAVAPASDLLGHSLDAVAPASDLLGHTLDAAAPGLALVGTTTDAVVAPVGGVVGTTLGAVDHAIAPVDHGPADSFGGSDPAAGIATLVGMVDSADAFDIGHTAVAAATQPAGSILDALAHDAMPAPLLGDDVHHDATPHGVDDHGIHLGL